MLVMPGITKRIEIRVRNYRRSKLQIQGVLVLPDGWKAQPASVNISVEAKSEARAQAEIAVPVNWSNPLSRVALALDVMANGKYLGQIAEAVADIRTRTV
jgi:hypothetical protein